MTRLSVLIERRKSLAKKQNIFSEPIRNTWINVLGKGLVICRSLPLAPPQQSMLLDNSGGEPEAKCLPFIHLNWQVVMVKNFTTFRTNNGKINEPGQILFVWKYAEKAGRWPPLCVPWPANKSELGGFLLEKNRSEIWKIWAGRLLHRSGIESEDKCDTADSDISLSAFGSWVGDKERRNCCYFFAHSPHNVCIQWLLEVDIIFVDICSK